MHKCYVIVLGLAAFALGVCPSTRADSVAATFTGATTSVGHGGNSATTLGWAFASSSDLLVTALG